MRAEKRLYRILLRSDLLGLSAFEQVVNTETDTTIYSFNKLISLLINCNPNTIGLLGCKLEHYFMLTDIGKQMIDKEIPIFTQDREFVERWL